MKSEEPILAQQCHALLRAPAWSERPFLIDGISHRSLHSLAARLYWQLHELNGVSGAGPVILASEDKTLCAAALLSALAGGPPLLLPYALSLQGLAALHAASGCNHVISSEELELPQGLHRVALPQNDLAQTTPPLPQTPAKGVVLSLFTGGSTGTPQLWNKTAANLFGEALFIATHHGIQTQDRIAATIAPYHIYGLLYSILLPLVSGAAVLVQTPAFPEEMVACVREHKISIFISVPAHYRALAGKSCAPSNLRLAFYSAGMLDAADNHSFCQANKTGSVEVYGSTETGGIACRNRFQGEEHFTVLPPIGWQLSPDERLTVRSPFLSPELPLDANGYFHTADRVAALDGARFSLLGRADLVVKVAGKRVDLEMIRRLLQEQAGVREVVVLALPEGGSRENRIAAILTATGPDECTINSLRHELSRHLEPYALPRIIKVVDHIPVRANGKYDREAILALVNT